MVVRNYRIFIEGEDFNDFFQYKKTELVYSHVHNSANNGGISFIRNLIDEFNRSPLIQIIPVLPEKDERILCISYSDVEKFPGIYERCDHDCKIPCERKGTVWRISDFKGIDDRTRGNPEDKNPPGPREDLFGCPESDDIPHFMLINDTGNGYGRFVHENVQMKKKFLEKCSRSNLIFLSSNPSLSHKSGRAHNETLFSLIPDKEKIIYITNIQDLRDSGADISYFLSWEKISQDVIWQIQYNDYFSPLNLCKLIIIRIDHDGVILINPQRIINGEKRPESYLFYDSTSIEGGFRANVSGKMKMKSTIFLVAVAKYFLHEGWCDDGDFNNLVNIDRNGINESDFGELFNYSLGLLRYHLLLGYKNCDGDICLQCDELGRYGKLPRLTEFYREKFENYEEIYSKNGLDRFMGLDQFCGSYSIIPVDNPCIEKFTTELQLSFIKIEKPSTEWIGDERQWSILCDYRRSRWTIGDVAYQLVQHNKITDQKKKGSPAPFPIYRLGRLISIDRCEIESYQGIRNTIQQYFKSVTVKAPLSIAVFGPPGSGKSFGIREIIRTITDFKTEGVEYDLSQFSGYGDLVKAFHHARGFSLKNIVPIIFFDEFDSKLESNDLGWLKFFLAPMQKGSFLDGESVHPIGKAIFVFAGGTSSSFEDFCYGKEIPPGEEKKFNEKFIAAKGPDFLSRLRGYIDIIGCNPLPVSDELFKVRRALLLRSIIRDKAPHLCNDDDIEIDVDVIRAFIKTSRYIHGTRSMEAIVEMSMLKEKKRYEVASFPSLQQLGLHTDAEEFILLSLRDVQFNESLDLIKKETEDILKTKMKEFIIAKKFSSGEYLTSFCKSIPDLLKSINYSFRRKKRSEILRESGISRAILDEETIVNIFCYLNRENPKIIDAISGIKDQEFEEIIQSLITRSNEESFKPHFEGSFKKEIINFIFWFYPRLPSILAKGNFIIYPL